MNHKLQAAEATALLEPSLAEGDLVFTRLRTPFGRYIADASASWTSHVGIVFRDPQGSWRVAESRIPRACYSSLESFLGRSEDCGVVVRRPRLALAPTDVAALRAQAERRFGQWYDTGFKYDRPQRAFCSKFTYDVYREALGLEIGRRENFRELLARNPEPRLGFWRLWYFGRIPWDRVTVTPASQLESPLLVDVYDRRRDFAGPKKAAIISSQYSA
ncbi:YiiX/YebB-like N1pC/P60 family cysteine hydrolase [Solimonas sp. K1W22B-7]|uniref:YiiX/YebB-like N1pC/P60 family cysteine hydrolase n=1 Tax=Solimonas sp. K1W22B-7 TaxID=2303331 RepID=UPI0013C3F15D|nr:YiiX/YebB-like N1pC/P60 family cysteine hydrolase [Solimonas sp. K1W22B-7]